MPKKVNENDFVDVVDIESQKFKKEINRYHKSTIEKPIETKVENELGVKSYYDSLSDNQKKIFREELKKRNAKESFAEYVKYCYPEFIFTPFHAFLCQVCDTVVKRIEKAIKDTSGKVDPKSFPRVLLSVPPRHGKTETVTKTLPSWFVGRNPDLNAILVAYNEDMAEKFNDANRQKLTDNGKDIFNLEISDSQNSKKYFEIKNHRGSCAGYGIGGGITGNGGELIIVDDPYKNSEEACSESIRARIEEMFRSAVYTRLQNKGNGMIIIHTRWHEDDLIGKLAKEDGWLVINIPAVCDTTPDIYLHRELGQTLFPERGFDSEWAERTKKSLGLKLWEALYQGHPSIDGGDTFKRDSIRYYTKSTLPLVFDKLTMSCDLSFGGTKKQNDPCSIQVWGKVGANHYLLKRINKRMTFIEMCDSIKNVSMQFPQCRTKLIERKANGQAVIDTLNDVVGGFIPVEVGMSDKVMRANAITPYIEAGNVFLPSRDIDSSIEEMVEEMMKFPNGKHDDDVDAMTQYLNYDTPNKGCGKIVVDSNLDLLYKAFRGLKL